MSPVPASVASMAPAASAALQLRDIHMPGAPAFWPPAPGWWLLAVILLVLLGSLSVFALRRYRLRRRRRLLLEALEHIGPQLSDARAPDALAQLSVLLRLHALACFPQRRVASLTGEAWLRFLDESGGAGRFSGGPGRVLASGPYRRLRPEELDPPGLLALVREWLLANRVPG